MFSKSGFFDRSLLIMVGSVLSRSILGTDSCTKIALPAQKNSKLSFNLPNFGVEDCAPNGGMVVVGASLVTAEVGRIHGVVTMVLFCFLRSASLPVDRPILHSLLAKPSARISSRLASDEGWPFCLRTWVVRFPYKGQICVGKAGIRPHDALARTH